MTVTSEPAAPPAEPEECAAPPSDFLRCDRCDDPASCEQLRTATIYEQVTEGRRRVSRRRMALTNGQPVSTRIRRGRCYIAVIDSSGGALQDRAQFEGEVDTRDLSGNHLVRERTPNLWVSTDQLCPRTDGRLKIIAWTGREWSDDGNTMLQAPDAGTGEVFIEFYETRIGESGIREIEAGENADDCALCLRNRARCILSGQPSCSDRFSHCLRVSRVPPNRCRP